MEWSNQKLFKEDTSKDVESDEDVVEENSGVSSTDGGQTDAVVILMPIT